MRPETGYFSGANQSCILKRGMLRGPHDSYLYRKYVQDLFANRVSMFQRKISLHENCQHMDKKGDYGHRHVEKNLETWLLHRY